MREWNLHIGGPFTLVLAADARLTPVDYFNDQIWELSLAAGEPPALSLQTTYGLRARSMRMYPRFGEGDSLVSNPANFSQPVTLRRNYPNFAQLDFSPLPGLETRAEYWVPGSQVIAGRFTFQNTQASPRSIRFEWIVALSPELGGQRMAVQEIQAADALTGSTAGLAPVVILGGGAAPGSGQFPSLVQEIELAAGGFHTLIWVQAALDSVADSFALARQVAARNWEAELARLILTNAAQIEIHTGDPDWDAALSQAQKTAFSLFVQPPKRPAVLEPEGSLHPAPVEARLPDQGYSRRGDGLDYTHLFTGPNPFEALFLAGEILPAAPAFAEGMLQNYLATQEDDGFIDWRPGLGGQRTGLLAAPVLSALALRIFQVTENTAFLAKVYPGLLRFWQAWFLPTQDRDQDGFPEWSHPMQAGFDSHPLFSSWETGSLGIDLSTVEDPGLCALLYHETRCLAEIASLIGQKQARPAFQARLESLQAHLKQAWDPQDNRYNYRDRDSHSRNPLTILGERRGSGEIPLQVNFAQPARLLFKLTLSADTRRPAQLFLHGTTPSGKHVVESFTTDQLRWRQGSACVTSQRTYASLELARLENLQPNDQVALYQVGYPGNDLAQLLPLWARAAPVQHARHLVQEQIIDPDRFWKSYGLPRYLPSPDGAIPACPEVLISWNTLIGEGLLNYGYRQEACELFSRLMKAAIGQLKRAAAFSESYHCETGAGLGERNSLEGLPPLGLFLKILGLRLVSNRKVLVDGYNPFLWPVTVAYRGLTILCLSEKTNVIFPDGQTVTISGPGPQWATQE